MEGEAHEVSFQSPFQTRPAYSRTSYPSYSTAPRTNSFPRQQYQQQQYPRQQYLQPQTSATFRPQEPRPQGSRHFQNPQPRVEFTPIPIPYAQAYAQLKEQGIVAPAFVEQVVRPPFPKWYNPKESCAYHNGVVGHDIENCVALKHKIEHLLKNGSIAFDNPLPQHNNRQINLIEEDTLQTFEHLIAPIKSFKCAEDRSLQKKPVKCEPSQQPQMVNTSQTPWSYGIHGHTANISGISSITRSGRILEEDEGTSRGVFDHLKW